MLAQNPTQRGEGPIVLVLGPTRELVLQIYEQTQKFTQGSSIRIACLYGGADKSKQRRDLYAGAQIVVACPGRLLDFLEEGCTNLLRVTYLVLDEADRMLDMGFEPQIRKVVEYIKGPRQTVMCSATWPREVQMLASEIFREEAVHIQIGDAELNANEKITQEVIVVEEDEKMRHLTKLLEGFKSSFSALIFTKTKKGCDRLSKELRSRGFYSMAIHGDKSQNEREFVLDTFRRKKVNILVATDVAARGLDIKNITYVINFDFPMQIEDYVHRIGRTGRAGESGIAISFFTSENSGLARELIKVSIVS
jgi:ATP-dependent RNA helicase DDX5/DBP2